MRRDERVSEASEEKPKAGLLRRLLQRGEAAPRAGRASRRRQRSWLSRLTAGLSRSSSAISRGVADIFAKRKLDAAALDDLEDILIQADLGLGAATRIREAVARGRYDKSIEPERSEGDPRRRSRARSRARRAAAGRRRGQEAVRRPGGRRQRFGQDDDDRQARGQVRRRGAQGDAGGRRHVPRRRDRAIEDLGAARPGPRSSRANRAATRRASPSTP